MDASLERRRQAKTESLFMADTCPSSHTRALEGRVSRFRLYPTMPPEEERQMIAPSFTRAQSASVGVMVLTRCSGTWPGLTVRASDCSVRVNRG